MTRIIQEKVVGNWGAVDVISTFLTEEEEEEEMTVKQSSCVVHLMTIVPEPVGQDLLQLVKLAVEHAACFLRRPVWELQA